jgi:XTP/dITP diphosphohydrolase
VKAVLASGNAHKLEELSAALPDWELELLGDHEFPPEDGATYVDNARIKARFGRDLAASDAWVLGEDSGIEVEGLGGRPGVRSARFAAGDPVGRLLTELAGVELVALAADGTERRGTGTLAGRIAHTPRGSEGFGYDPIFVPAGETRTVAELGDDWKRTNSHRARAAQALRAVI